MLARHGARSTLRRSAAARAADAAPRLGSQAGSLWRAVGWRSPTHADAEAEEDDDEDDGRAPTAAPAAMEVDGAEG